MDELDQRLVERAKRLFERAQPGLIARLEAFGGSYLTVPCEAKAVGDSLEELTFIQTGLAFRVASPALRLKIRASYTADRTATVFTVKHCSLHCGSVDDEVTHFRIDWNKLKDLHFHQRGCERYQYPGKRPGHLPADKAIPTLTTNPLEFLALVEKFIVNGKLPYEVKR